LELLAPRPTPNLEDQWTTLTLLPFDLSGLGDPARSLGSRHHTCRCYQSSQPSPPATFASRRC